MLAPPARFELGPVCVGEVSVYNIYDTLYAVVYYERYSEGFD